MGPHDVHVQVFLSVAILSSIGTKTGCDGNHACPALSVERPMGSPTHCASSAPRTTRLYILEYRSSITLRRIFMVGVMVPSLGRKLRGTGSIFFSIRAGPGPCFSLAEMWLYSSGALGSGNQCFRNEQGDMLLLVPNPQAAGNTGNGSRRVPAPVSQNYSGGDKRIQFSEFSIGCGATNFPPEVFQRPSYGP